MKTFFRRYFASFTLLVLAGPLSAVLSAAQLTMHHTYNCGPQGNTPPDFCLKFDFQVGIDPTGTVSALIKNIQPAHPEAWISVELTPIIGVTKFSTTVRVGYRIRYSGYQKTYSQLLKKWVMDPKVPLADSQGYQLSFDFKDFPELQNIQNFTIQNLQPTIFDPNSPQTELPANPPQANPPVNPPQQEPPYCAILHTVQGKVYVKKADQPVYKQVKEGARLDLGDTVKTETDGSATIQLSGGSSVTIKPDTEFIIPGGPANTNEKVSVVKVMKGALWARAKKEENSLNVATPNAICGTRGTEFEVSVIGDKTCVEVYDGVVWLRDLANNKTVDIKAGSKSCVGGDQPPSAPVPGAAAVPAGTVTFQGRWQTTFDKLEINLTGLRAGGTYIHDNGKIEGTLSADGRTLMGTWSEAPSYKPPQDAGKFILKLADDGQSFSGRWCYGFTESAFAQIWNGKRLK